MENILLINPPSIEPPPTYFGPPYGLALIAAVLEQNGKTPVCLDSERDTIRGSIDKINEILKKNPIKYIGISCQSANRGKTYDLIRKIKEMHKDIFVILGGPFATQKYELILRNFPVDFIVDGEGQTTFNELINCLDSGKDTSNVRGIAYRINGKILKTEDRGETKNLDSLPYPAFHLFDVMSKLKGTNPLLFSELKRKKIKEKNGKKYTGIPNALMLLSSVGCTYSCSFCPMSGISKNKYREHSVDYFVSMVEHFKIKYDHDRFVFGDNFFTKDIERTKKICDEIAKRKLNIEWSCMTRTDYVNKELLRKMKKAGCIEISFGVESGSSKVQKKIGKNLDLNSIGRSFELCNQVGIRPILMLMVGNQGETKETIYETLSMIRHLEPDEVIIQLAKVYPGIKIHGLAERKGIVSDSYYLGTNPIAPSFTFEKSLDELNHFKSMFKLRDIKLPVSNSCNNNCVYCDKVKINDFKTKQFKKEILKLAKRASTITFCGKEPTLNKATIDMVKYVRKIGINEINLETNARIFSYSKMTKSFLQLGVNQFIIHFFTDQEGVHDSLTRTKGSFKQTVKGIRNILHNSGEGRAVANIRIFDLNYERLEQTISYLISLGVNKYIFTYNPAKNMNLPRLDELKTHLEKAISELRKHDKKFTINGLPYCILPDCEDQIDEIHRPFDEKLGAGGNLINIGKERRKQKTKKAKCKKCKYDYICEGFWKNA